MSASKFPSAIFRGSVASTVYRANATINSMRTLNGAVSGASSRALYSAARRIEHVRPVRREGAMAMAMLAVADLQRRTARPEFSLQRRMDSQRRLRYGDGGENDGD